MPRVGVVDPAPVLQAIGVTGAAVAASPMLSARAAFAADPYTGPILLVISLRGGMDGLSLVPPIGDADYARKRPNIAVPAATAIPTGNRTFGMHPALAPLQPLWAGGKLAFVHAVGSPDSTRSHFSATDELERAAPGTSIRTGWLDRVLGVAGTGSTFEAVALGSGGAPRLLSGPSNALAVDSLEAFELQSLDWVGPRLTTVLRTLYSNADLPYAAAATTTLDALDTAAAVLTNHGGPRNSAVYPENSHLGGALADAAALIRADVGLQALAVDVGDWDMHSGLGNAGEGEFAAKAGEVAAAIAAFATDLGTAFNRITVVTLSEFGRRVEENGSGGVDHGFGNAVLLAGGGLVGSTVHGTWPTLADAELDQGDLAGTTDFRNVLGEYLVKRAGLTTSQLATVFPGITPQFVGAFS
ncbi:DUF1501 domain-containing protein [Sporichthya sp.]|uniref:DUF1501 domain-containing protein n=1 Tax=Sporichthya sp. TaxID=65475 RepID=UPI0025D0BAF5|nr:DUF1501 domain-containing protein [Sporichthya sp.]